MKKITHSTSLGQTKKDAKASSVKHEINNVLAVISLSVEMAMHDPSQAKKNLSAIRSQIKKIQLLLKKL